MTCRRNIKDPENQCIPLFYLLVNIKKSVKCTKYNDDTGSFYPESYYIFTKVREFILNKTLFQKNHFGILYT